MGIDLQQHFQNYFELLLSAERSKLRVTIPAGRRKNAQALLSEVDYSIAYLKGAVRMGRLLCLISSEDAKLKNQILMRERDELLTLCSEPFDLGRAAAPVAVVRDYKSLLRESK